MMNNDIKSYQQKKNIYIYYIPLLSILYICTTVPSSKTLILKKKHKIIKWQKIIIHSNTHFVVVGDLIIPETVIL